MKSTRLASRALVAGALALAVAALGAGDASPPRRSVYVAKLPPGEGREATERACLMCHSAMLITQQHKDSTAWEKSVKLMEAWGAPVAPAEHAVVIGYLTQQLGPTKK
jgi:cytochrome c5